MIWCKTTESRGDDMMDNVEFMNQILKLDNQLCFRLYAVSRNMTRLYQPFLDKHQLTYPQYVVMLVMFEEKEIDFKKLAERVDLRTATLTPIVKKLESLGYVSRKPNNLDQRKINVVLTPEGEQLKRNIVDVPLGTAEALGLDFDSYEVLVQKLDQLLDLLKNALEEQNRL
jgi:DNA-binding MarR family transcriptional regulator